MMKLIAVSSRVFENHYDIVSYRRNQPPGRVNYLTLITFLIDLPHDSLIFSIYIPPHHDDLSRRLKPD